jgi:hypothetical protein
MGRGDGVMPILQSSCTILQKAVRTVFASPAPA